MEHIMPRVMKEVFGIILCLFISCVFAGAGAFVFFGILQPPMIVQKILKNGIETTATVIGMGSNLKISSSSSSRSNSTSYYWLKLSFINSAGETVVYKTNSIYPESFIGRMEIAKYNKVIKKYEIAKKETIRVISLGNKAVVRGFSPDNAPFLLWFWFFPTVFGAIGIGILILLAVGLVKSLVKSLGQLLIKRYGTSATGIYSTHTHGTVSLARLCTIYFTFENANGKTVESKAEFVNSDVEAETLIKMQSFPVKYIGKKTVIMLKKNEIR
jgi:hypothetical protein